MNKFITAVSMQITPEQYEKDLKEPLEALGYKWDDMYSPDKNYRYGYNHFTNCYDRLGRLGNLYHTRGHFIDHYNPELFLALSAMTEGTEWIVGEWLVTQNIISEYHNGKIFQCKSLKGTDYESGAAQNGSAYYRKATKEEIINHFTKNTNEMEKKIIGYKLIKEEYLEAALKIGNLQPYKTKKELEEVIKICLPNSSTVKYLKEAGVLDLWFEPVYEEEYKVGDYIYYNYNGVNESGGRVDKIISFDEGKLVTDNSSNLTSVKDLQSGVQNAHIRKATQQEIENSKQKTFKIGDFTVVTRNKQAFYGFDNITEFVKGICNIKTSGIFGGYTFNIEDIIFSKTGCQQKSKLSEWIKVYDEIK